MLDGNLSVPGGFEAVWKRVSCSRDSCGDGGAAVLREFMLKAARACELYRSLSRKMPGCARTLCRLADEERCRLRALSGEYYLLTGECFAPPPACPLACGCLSALREAYLAETENAKAYRAAACSAEGDIAQLYERSAECEDCHAAALRGLILRAI